jgi:hypothetical protein
MYTFDIAQARRLAAHALSRAHMTGGDFRQKRLWQDIAEEWCTRAEALEERQRDLARSPRPGEVKPAIATTRHKARDK